MKREILFKAKDLNGNWVQGHYFSTEVHEIETDCMIVGSDTIYIRFETLSQFTGITDANGVKIFEGDRLKMSDYHTKDVWETNVRFEHGSFLVDVEHCDYNVTPLGFIDDDTLIELTGNNIHD